MHSLCLIKNFIRIKYQNFRQERKWITNLKIQTI